jgi:hypothetical protein
MIERFFRDITTERPCRGVFTSVSELVKAIDEYVAHPSGPETSVHEGADRIEVAT